MSGGQFLKAQVIRCAQWLEKVKKLIESYYVQIFKKYSKAFQIPIRVSNGIFYWHVSCLFNMYTHTDTLWLICVEQGLSKYPKRKWKIKKYINFSLL